MIHGANTGSSAAATEPRHIDPAAVLPTELVSEIFLHLSMSGRLAASRVCASWRRIALADRRLWSQHTISLRYSRNISLTGKARSRIIDAATGALAALLKRSDPLPFRLACEFDVPDAIVGLVVSHMARMESLSLGAFESDDAFQRVLAQDAPILKSFTYSRYALGDPHGLISARWAISPLLAELDLGRACVWPSGCAFPTLRSFTGLLPEGDAYVSRMFPNVTALRLRNVTQPLIKRLDPLPRSLMTLSLHTDWEGVDCTALLRGCTAPHLRELTVDHMTTSACVLAFVCLFVRTFDVPWKLHANSGVFWITVPGPPACVEYVCVCPVAASWPEILPLCHRLEEIDLRPRDVLQLCSASAALPALVAARVFLVGQHDHSLAGSLEDGRCIHAPTLRVLTVQRSTHDGFDTTIGALLEAILRAFRSPRLARVVVGTHSHHETFPHEAFAALWPLAECVEVQNPDGSVMSVFLLEDPSLGRGASGRDADGSVE